MLRLNLAESPFFAQYGIAGEQAVIQQVWPDYTVAQTQKQFAGYFAALIIYRQPGATSPTYVVNVTFNDGTQVSATVQQ